MPFLFPIAPIAGESLSSWRQRVALANGYRLFPVMRGEQRRRDHDFLAQGAIQALAHFHQIDLSSLSGLSLDSFEGTLFVQTNGRRRHPSWVLPLRYSKLPTSHGAMCCAACLAQDNVPHFRLRWRLSCLTVCPHHGVLLLDRCPWCKSSLWPSTAAQTHFVRSRITEGWRCAFCFKDLRCSETVAADPQATSSIERILDGDNPIKVGGPPVTTDSFFAALSVLAQAFLRRRLREQIIRGASSWSDLASLVECEKVNDFDQLSVSMRYRLMPALLELLSHWPDNFLSFVTQSKLDRYHFYESRNSCPGWLGDVITKHMSRQRRGITPAAVSSTIDAAERERVRVTQSEINRRLGATNSKEVRARLGRRDLATAVEFEHVIDCLLKLIETEGTATRGWVIARDALVILLMVADAGIVRTGDYEGLARTEVVTIIHSTFGESASELLAAATSMLDRTRGHGDPDEAYLSPYRGQGLPIDSAKRLLSAAMRGLDRRLRRNVEVFARAQVVQLTLAGV